MTVGSRGAGRRDLRVRAHQCEEHRRLAQFDHRSLLSSACIGSLVRARQSRTANGQQPAEEEQGHQARRDDRRVPGFCRHGEGAPPRADAGHDRARATAVRARAGPRHRPRRATGRRLPCAPARHTRRRRRRRSAPSTGRPSPRSPASTRAAPLLPPPRPLPDCGRTTRPPANFWTTSSTTGRFAPRSNADLVAKLHTGVPPPSTAKTTHSRPEPDTGPTEGDAAVRAGPGDQPRPCGHSGQRVSGRMQIVPGGPHSRGTGYRPHQPRPDTGRDPTPTAVRADLFACRAGDGAGGAGGPVDGSQLTDRSCGRMRKGPGAGPFRVVAGTGFEPATSGL